VRFFKWHINQLAAAFFNKEASPKPLPLASIFVFIIPLLINVLRPVFSSATGVA
jgi:hypothetical protein